jgi:hypothetical protein
MVVAGGAVPRAPGVGVAGWEWGFKTAEELAAAVRAGEVSSVELVDEVIGRIEREGKAVNAVCRPRGTSGSATSGCWSSKAIR